ncbi:DNA-binding MarR family transcriptional regulator [Hamadaea flava]|uniref:MarR family winged helix-turn-helix transcriptional regulator n=1 Tax=Hamadaea flava TaxID=1742688 RepID=A0ABV8LNZ1_9ACTN|nr:MarR family transcriptional regulator [Hamadaea flava]MCP2321567.1 DNA-binding MarR family transcriptional regulator [Hamadaea flava]
MADDNRAQTWRELARTYTRVSAALESALQQSHAVSANDFEILSALTSTDGGYLRMQRLADATGLPLSTTSRLVSRLETVGLLARYVCPDDRRGVFTQITPDGRRMQKAAARTFGRTLDQELA